MNLKEKKENGSGASGRTTLSRPTTAERELPAGWILATLDELTRKIHYGYTASSQENDTGVRMLRITDIQDQKVDWVNVPFCEIDSKNLEKYLLQENDIVFARTGATVGKSFLIRGLFPKSVFASYLIRVILNEEIPPSYVYYFFQSNRYWTQIKKGASGIGQPNVNATKLSKLEIPLPPLPEQHRIVARLDALLGRVEEVRRRLERVPELLRQFRQSVLARAVSGELTRDWREGHPEVEGAVELLKVVIVQLDDKVKKKAKGGFFPKDVNLPNIPSSWTYCYLDAFLNHDRGGMRTGPFGSALKKHEHKQKGVPILGIENIGRGEFLYGNKVFVTKEKAHDLKAFDILENEIIISRSGTVGEICVIPPGLGEARMSTNLIRVSLNHKVIDSKYFSYLFLGSTWVLSKVKSLCAGSTRDFLNQKIMRSIEYPIPPLPEQQEIVRRVESLFAIADRIEERWEQVWAQVETLPQAILAKAFRGELVAQDPND